MMFSTENTMAIVGFSMFFYSYSAAAESLGISSMGWDL